MANIASQKKRILRSERERTENRLLTSTVKTHFRRLESAVEGGDADAIAAEHRDLVSKIDKAVQKGAMHKNTGARKKSKAARIARPPPRSSQAAAVAPAARPQARASAPARRRSRRRRGTRPRGRRGRRSPAQVGDVGVAAGGRPAASPRRGACFEPRLDLLGRDPLLQLAAGGAGVAQARGEAVDQAGDVLALGDQPLGDPQRRRRRRARAGRRRATRRPPRRCRRPSRRGRRRSPLRPRPPRARGAPARCCRRTGLAPIRSTRTRAAAGSRRKPSRLASATRTRGISRAFGASNSWISPFAALTAFASFAGALARAIRTRVRSGGSSATRRGDGLELPVAPALDPVGEQVAARLGQRHRRDRRQQRLVVGRPRPSPGSKTSSASAPPSRSARARRRARVASIFAPSVPAIR